MLEIADILNSSHIFDFLVAGVTFLVGGFAVFRKFFQKKRIGTIGITLQVVLLILKMSRHYYSTHPEAKKKLDRAISLKLDKIYAHLRNLEPLKTSKETGAIG